MRSRSLIPISLWGILITLTSFTATSATKIALTTKALGEITISVNPSLHQEFGLAYPVTYQLTVPAGSSHLHVSLKHQEGASWSPLPEKTAQDFFNGLEAVRFDYSANCAYVSVGFDSLSDDIFLRVTDEADQPVNVQFQNICRYYDNRQAVVTISADDWSDPIDADFRKAIETLRSYNIPVTVGIITQHTTSATWQSIQEEIDRGGVDQRPIRERTAVYHIPTR